MKRLKYSIALSLLGAAAAAQLPPADIRNFVSCPIVRDTSTVPCWLSEYEGELYYLGIQTDISADFHPPYLEHQVVVEGTVSNAPRICGGIVLDPVKISVVAEIDKNCDQILPAEDRYQIDFSPRPPGPSGGRLAFGGPGDPGARQPPPPLTGPQTFTIRYEFDGKVEGPNAGELGQIVRYAEQIKASRIEITGYRSSILLSDGSVLEEKADLGKTRAKEAALLLMAGGLSGYEFDVNWEQAPAADGVQDWAFRKTEVTVLP